MTICEIRKQTESNVTCKEYKAKIVDVALEHKNGYLIVNKCSIEVLNDSEALYLIYENEDMPAQKGEMPMAIFSYNNPEEYDDWLNDVIDKYNLLDDKGLYDFSKLKEQFCVKATYDENGDIVEQQLVELK